MGCKREVDSFKTHQGGELIQATNKGSSNCGTTLLAPALVSGDKPPRHNPAHSLTLVMMPELRALLGPLMSPENPLSEPEVRLKRDRKRAPFAMGVGQI